jgi:hypothetical protein
VLSCSKTKKAPTFIGGTMLIRQTSAATGDEPEYQCIFYLGSLQLPLESRLCFCRLRKARGQVERQHFQRLAAKEPVRRPTLKKFLKESCISKIMPPLAIAIYLKIQKTKDRPLCSLRSRAYHMLRSSNKIFKWGTTNQLWLHVMLLTNVALGTIALSATKIRYNITAGT